LPPNRRIGGDVESAVNGCWIGFQGGAPDLEHDGLDDPRPEHENAANQRNRTQSERDAAADQYHTGKDERRRNEPEEARVFDGSIAF